MNQMIQALGYPGRTSLYGHNAFYPPTDAYRLFGYQIIVAGSDNEPATSKYFILFHFEAYVELLFSVHFLIHHLLLHS